MNPTARKITKVTRLVIMVNVIAAALVAHAGSEGETSIPPAIFSEHDITKISGIDLGRLKGQISTFLTMNKGHLGFPEANSLEGVWIFGIKDRIENDGDAYISTQEMAKALRKRNKSPASKYYYYDVQFVWDLRKLHLGRWTFYLDNDQEIRAVASSTTSNAKVGSRPVAFVAAIDRSDYHVIKWAIEENPLH